QRTGTLRPVGPPCEPLETCAARHGPNRPSTDGTAPGLVGLAGSEEAFRWTKRYVPESGGQGGEPRLSPADKVRIRTIRDVFLRDGPRRLVPMRLQGERKIQRVLGQWPGCRRRLVLDFLLRKKILQRQAMDL